MRHVNKDRFVELYNQYFGRKGPQERLIEFLGFMETDEKLTEIPQCAYVLATVYHETAHSFIPCEEIGKGKGKRYGKPDPTTGLRYYGRGYVQTTWFDNYKTVTSSWNRNNPEDPQDFVLHPEKLLEPKYAYFATSYPMRKGLYTGAYLSLYIHNGVKDYLKARKIINGLDCAAKIADYAEKFEKILNSTMEA